MTSADIARRTPADPIEKAAEFVFSASPARRQMLSNISIFQALTPNRRDRQRDFTAEFAAKFFAATSGISRLAQWNFEVRWQVGYGRFRAEKSGHS